MSEDLSGLDTFPKLLAHHARVRAERPAIREKDLGIWQTWSWRRFAEEVRAIACGLAADGFKRGDHLALVVGLGLLLLDGDGAPRALPHAGAEAVAEQVAAQATGVGQRQLGATLGRRAGGRPLGVQGSRDQRLLRRQRQQCL